jgi:dihydrofolate reductase
MRRTVVNNIVSLDGFYADQSGNPTVLNMDETFDAYNLERLQSAGTVLLGRTSFEGFGAYWPAVADAAEDPDNRALSPDNREISRLYNRVAKIVVSDSLNVPADHPWAATTTVIRRGRSGHVAGTGKTHWDRRHPDLRQSRYVERAAGPGAYR